MRARAEATGSAPLRTIVIVLMSQLFHCAYTNPSQLSSKPVASLGNLNRQYLNARLMQVSHQFSQPESVILRPEGDKFVGLETVGGGGGLIVSGLGGEAVAPGYVEEDAGLIGAPSDDSSAADSLAVDRCRELINLALVSFRDLPALNVRSMDEIDCDALRAQMAAAASRSLKQMKQQQQRLQQQQQQQQQQRRKLAMQQVASANQENEEPEQYSRQSFSAQAEHANVTMNGWTPKGVLMSQQMQQVLAQRQLRRQQEQAKLQATTTSTTQAPTTQATTFESLFETTTQPPTTTAEPTTTAAPTTTTTTTHQPKIRVFPAKRGRAGAQKNRKQAAKATTSTTTTTTTTTTSKPSTTAKAEYADGSELSTDYYDEYDDQGHTTTTTTTTTARPQRGAGRRKPKRMRTTSTSPRPSTTSTTLSPGYQPRPDGRIIDYMADPNLPRELKGVDLTNYPFYISVPDKIDFECKGRHDGYYTNIDLHCQIYHHCAVGNRYDFLCPNYTLFDQTTFTCRFINTVDCAGSVKHFDRNNDLYVEKEEKGAASSSTSTTTSTTVAPAPANTSSQPPEPRIGLQLSPRARPEARVSALALIQGARTTSAPP